MSLAASVCHAEWQGAEINLVDTPGDPGFQADTLAALGVVEGALFVVNGVNASRCRRRESGSAPRRSASAGSCS